MAVATVWLEDANGRRWPVAATCALGRSSSNDIVIDDGKVSRRHALVHKQDDAQYWVIDLGSGNGTYLNGRRVIQPTQLSNGDSLQLGDHALSFRQIAQRPFGRGDLAGRPLPWPAGCAPSTATGSSSAAWPAGGRCSASASACR